MGNVSKYFSVDNMKMTDYMDIYNFSVDYDSNDVDDV